MRLLYIPRQAVSGPRVRASFASRRWNWFERFDARRGVAERTRWVARLGGLHRRCATDGKLCRVSEWRRLTCPPYGSTRQRPDRNGKPGSDEAFGRRDSDRLEEARIA